ncbi:MAG TPA: ATP-binding protein, partial [Burkholderiaceae bacterium]|nr:ATP-binding protein [Burkholderiaceae bacterium]
HIDVTAQKEAEIALADHAERLREADRRKDEFLAMLGHELRNPMAAMRSVSELLGRLPASLPDEVRRAHDVIDRQLDHLTVLVDDLLDVARIHTGRIVLERRLVEIGGIVRTALEQSAGLIERRRHRCEVTLPDRPVHVEGDPARLIQVVTNLLNNAAKFTEPGGRIGVTAAVDGGTVEIVVEDNGVGIAPELLPHVFDLFVQSQRPIDRAGGGLGVGLTLAQEIVHQHGGTISAHSDESGSRFRVSLPCVRGSVAAQAAPAATVNRPAHLHRVLVIDDNLDAAETLAMLLEIDGHEVRKLHDGSQVIDEVRRFAPRVVLLDLGLPGRDGFDIARELRACSDLRQPVLIAITGYGQESDRRRSRESGFDHHFVKPIRYEALSELIGGIEPFPSGEATAPAP